MAAIETDAEPTKVLEFGLGDGTYCLDIGVIDEIVDAGELTRIPNSPDHVEGVMDLRGRTTTIVDPKTLFAIDEEGPRERIVVFDDDEIDEGGTVAGWSTRCSRSAMWLRKTSIRRRPSTTRG